jgi:ABC-2 type transport system permease protein
MWSRVLDISRKELLQLRRDRRMLPLVIISPVLQLIIYGYAISTTVSHITTAIYDASRTPQSRSLVLSMESSTYFDVNYYLDNYDEIDGLVDSGRATVAIVIPYDFARKLASGRTTVVQAIIDGSDPNTATTSLGYLSAIFRRYSQNIIVQRIGRLPQAGVNPKIRVWYNPTLESRNYMIPGIIAFVLLQITMNLTALSIVREKERGTIEQLIVTPIRRWELIVGKALPYVGVGYLDIFLVLLVGTQVFKVPIQGSVILLLALSGLFLLSALGLGLFISTIAKNQQQAGVAMPFIMMPNFLLSGFFFPIDNMPRFVQVVTYFIPLRYYLAIVRAIFLKGTGLSLLWPQVIPMALLGMLILSLSVLGFRKKL